MSLASFSSSGLESTPPSSSAELMDITPPLPLNLDTYFKRVLSDVKVLKWQTTSTPHTMSRDDFKYLDRSLGWLARDIREQFNREVELLSRKLSQKSCVEQERDAAISQLNDKSVALNAEMEKANELRAEVRELGLQLARAKGLGNAWKEISETTLAQLRSSNAAFSAFNIASDTQTGSVSSALTSHNHECSLCLDAESDALFPCGHVACCVTCAHQLSATANHADSEARCPICRAQGGFRKIYFA